MQAQTRPGRQATGEPSPQFPGTRRRDTGRAGKAVQQWLQGAGLTVTGTNEHLALGILGHHAEQAYRPPPAASAPGVNTRRHLNTRLLVW